MAASVAIASWYAVLEEELWLCRPVWTSGSVGCWRRTSPACCHYHSRSWLSRLTKTQYKGPRQRRAVVSQSRRGERAQSAVRSSALKCEVELVGDDSATQFG